MILFISRERGGKNFVTTRGGTKTFPYENSSFRELLLLLLLVKKNAKVTFFQILTHII